MTRSKVQYYLASLIATWLIATLMFGITWFAFGEEFSKFELFVTTFLLLWIGEFRERIEINMKRRDGVE